MSKEFCTTCETEASVVRELREVTIGRRTVAVEEEFFRCVACGEEFFLPEQMDRSQRLAVDKIREQDGLLTPEEIKTIRRKYDVTQAELEIVLGVGPKTVVRWERGTVCQGRAVDTLLRTLNQFEFAFWHWAERRGVQFKLPFAPDKWDYEIVSVRAGASADMGTADATADMGTADWNIRKPTKIPTE